MQSAKAWSSLVLWRRLQGRQGWGPSPDLLDSSAVSPISRESLVVSSGTPSSFIALWARICLRP